ncbi:hypothetical protein MCOR02_010447 [Pyricularia oryzae]|nr:uncharacterized protein MGG_05744 [Pyricularia oryzae 70-15]ELQ37906.1 hypothetical protein OOU_Y34scaffold00567g53 [Pyricularia oryzae Y34]KAH8845117.1 hypothetical protein MCOR01_002370 [Pyricularia oryzae]EHA58047.1 hypothetical protein MGG_05744 [Pyricularia oryzae 70-15]KAH9429035.1 hypothetical protein MCOR02_010447 [Pyricularia oryzae]KAI6256678.1 hypothetical protein MCOR19_006863 [Pyricularia oryzae]
MAALALLLPVANAEGGFTKTCFLGGASLDDKKYLGTTCTNEKYEIYGFDYSALNLDWCLTNDGGRLAFASDGKFSGSCHECKFDKNSDKGRFSCRCSDGSGELKDETHVELGTEPWAAMIMWPTSPGAELARSRASDVSMAARPCLSRLEVSD